MKEYLKTAEVKEETNEAPVVLETGSEAVKMFEFQDSPVEMRIKKIKKIYTGLR